MKINWFSPLPPSQTAGARLTSAVVPTLARKAEVVVWSSAVSANSELERSATVRTYDASQPRWREINRAEINIFHLGDDSHAYGDVFAVSRQLPGIVVLHDFSFQRLFAGLAARDRFLTRRDYVRLSELHYPGVGRLATDAFLRGTISLDELAAECSLLPAALSNALAVIVSSDDALALVQAHQPSLPVIVIPSNAAPLAYADALLALAQRMPECQEGWALRVLARRVGAALDGWYFDEAEEMPVPSRVTEELLALNGGAT